MTLFEKIVFLMKKLYPSGRAFKMTEGGVSEKLHKGLAESEKRAVTDALSTLSAILPDNDQFTADDASDWERRLGMITNPLVPLADRKLALLRKMNHPGTIKARQHYLYIQDQLQKAGFNVFVYENIFPDGMGGYDTVEPWQVLSKDQHGDGQHNDFQHADVYSLYPNLFFKPQHGDIQHGDIQHGEIVFKNKIVNFIDESLDQSFNVGQNLRCTFFIGGDPFGTFAEVSAERKNEFRQLILKLKPAQTVGFLFINYV